MSLKENLENFLEHYQHMTELSSTLDGSDAFDMEFTHLKQISQKYRVDKVFPTSCGESDTNIRKNRYKDILPFDHSRFILTQIDNQEGSDYINANYIKGVSNDQAYLAAQGPLPHTVNDFWRMLWESNTQIIVMACNEFEQGRHKCERYWVDEGEEHLFGDILVTQIRQQRVTKDFMIRTLKATRDKEEKIFNQFHYTAWPDHGVPTSVRPILEMIKLVREYQPKDNPPVVIHCSAGCGRTGTICVIDYVRHALSEEKIDQNFSLYEIIVEMRRQRHAIVQTRNQYELVHRAVVDIFSDYMGIKPDSKDDYGHNYENVQLRHEHFEQPRMPPKMPGQSSPDKRDSQSHNYVNCDLTQGGVSVDSQMLMPKLPQPPASKPKRGNDSPDVGSLDQGDNSKSGNESPGVGGGTAKQMPQARSRQTPDDRYNRNFQATMTAFKDFELEGGSQSQPQAQARPKPGHAIKPLAASKPAIAGKPGKLAKPSPPVKPGSLDGASKTGTSSEANPVEKVSISRQDSNPLWTTGRDASPPSARSALKIPIKPMTWLEKSKSDGGESPVSPSIRQGAMKPIFKVNKFDRPAQPPPKPPTNPKPPLQRNNGEERSSLKGSHNYEPVHISPPPDKTRSSPTQLGVDAVDSKEGGNITRKKTELSRIKFPNGSVSPSSNSESKHTRKSSEDYSYVENPKSMIEKLIKDELAYSEVSEPNQMTSTSLVGNNSEYSYASVDMQKAGPPEKPKRGKSLSSEYDLVNIPSSDPFPDGSYSCLSPTGGDDEDADAPMVPERTAQSFQLVDDEDKEEKTSSGGAMTKLKQAVARDTRDFLRRIGGAINKPVTGNINHGNAPTAASESAKHANINELLEKTLRDYQPAYKEGPVVYKEQDVGFPKRLAAPRGSRSPPRTWGVRPSDVQSAQVRL